MADHTFYERVADDLERGWVRWNFTKGDRKCLVQGLRRQGEKWYVTPQDVVEEVNDYLLRYRDYRWLVYLRPHASASESNIIKWNDLPWRRKRQVVHAMRRLAAEKEFAWLRNERLRLSIEISSLREQVSDLREQVSMLQRENAHLLTENAGLLVRARRAFAEGYKTYLSDQRTLSALEVELDAKAAQWDELFAEAER